MRLQNLRNYALSLPGTTWVKQWGECLVFKVAGKMFLLLVLEAETIDGVVFKCTPEEFDALTEIDGIGQAPYCAKRHWVRVSDLLALPPDELERRIRRSYALVVAKLPKKTQAALGGLPAGGQPSMKPPKKKSESSAARHDALLATLAARFEKNPNRHPKVSWADVRTRLEARPEKLATLAEMEATGGEPDVVGVDARTGEVLFVDCAPQSPKGRVSLCYDRDALEARKEHKPKDSAMDLAAAWAVELLTEDEYHALQKLGEFDTKSSSWLRTPPEIRALGDAIFGDRRFGRVFIYHNGAESYYSGRGFRVSLRV